MKSPLNRQKQLEQTKAKLLACAKAELLSVGFEKMTLRSVAACAGVAVGTVLLHYENKQCLLHSALYSDLTAVWEEIKTNPVPETIRDEIRMIFEGLFGYYTHNPLLSQELLRESLFARDPWREKFVELAGDLHEELAVRLTKAQQSGQTMSQNPPPLMALSLISFYYFALISWVQQAVPHPSALFNPLADSLLQTETPQP